MRDDKPEARRRNRSRDRHGKSNTSLLSDDTTATTIKTGHRQPQAIHREKSRSKGMERGAKLFVRDRAPHPRERHEYETPFDKSGRCHYHVNVLLATKKNFGGWHILFQVCPKCMEEKTNKSTTRRKKDGTSGEETSLMNRGRTTDFARSSSRGRRVGGGSRGHQHDDNGCCIVHSHIQIATKKLLGGAWKVTGMCPICNGGSATSLLDDDAQSAKSGVSNRSNTSRKSTRSMNTTTTSRVSSGKAKSSRYDTLPFDSDGYCRYHPSVQIAQRKLMGGGYKIIHDTCPDCARDDNRSWDYTSQSRGGGVRSRSLSQQRRRTHDGCSPRHQNNTTIRRGSTASDIASFKQKLFSEFRM